MKFFFNFFKFLFEAKTILFIIIIFFFLVILLLFIRLDPGTKAKTQIGPFIFTVERIKE